MQDDPYAERILLNGIRNQAQRLSNAVGLIADRPGAQDTFGQLEAVERAAEILTTSLAHASAKVRAIRDRERARVELTQKAKDIQAAISNFVYSTIAMQRAQGQSHGTVQFDLETEVMNADLRSTIMRMAQDATARMNYQVVNASTAPAAHSFIHTTAMFEWKDK